MAVTVTAHPDGATLAVRAQPGARKDAVGGERAGALKVAVTAPPQDGRANEAVVALLREAFGLKRSRVELLTGHASRNKVVLVRGVSAEALAGLVAAAGA